jgi:ribosomal protein S18 acetylase RimI-like enzyme
MLNYALEQVTRLTNVSQVYLHVQTSNIAAVGFYKAHGFAVADTVQDYYKRIEPTTAYLLQLDINRKSDA